MSYIGNQLLCRKPVTRNCTDPESVRLRYFELDLSTPSTLVKHSNFSHSGKVSFALNTETDQRKHVIIHVKSIIRQNTTAIGKQNPAETHHDAVQIGAKFKEMAEFSDDGLAYGVEGLAGGLRIEAEEGGEGLVGGSMGEAEEGGGKGINKGGGGEWGKGGGEETEEKDEGGF
ncbi:hypothetical protein RJ639_035520 [Escallonia herrerae]|uniref:Uncharacterized protein n=1 Tax=Escallonia herrerae TaxID=1293975 RepID=A0AA88WRH3_9ASTE|nr:hypothetical protein RJ639_037075 [Escallonia herrerae]KAK3032227.1 hypothetical protein RJ639_035520 [Escallonia herrerae]